MSPSHAPRRIALASAATVLAVAVTLAACGSLDAVAWLGIPPMSPPFADLRPITGAGEALARGLDPLVANPGDPWGRPMNYPRVWLALAEFGVGPEHTPVLAALMWTCFAAAAALLSRAAADLRGAWLLAAAFASPPTWFALERANTDLAMLALVAAAATFATARAGVATALLGAASALKLYPVLAGASLLGARPRAARAGIVVLVASFAAYAWWTRDDVELMRASTQRWAPLSHGASIAPRMLSDQLGFGREVLAAAALVFAAAVVVLALRVRRREHTERGGLEPVLSGASKLQLSFFRAGAAVHAGAFLVDTSFDYRLLFLALTLPAWSAWSRSHDARLRRSAKFALAATLATLWALAWRRGLDALLPGGDALGRVLDEFACWSVWCANAAALVISAPHRSAARARRAIEVSVSSVRAALPAPSRPPSRTPADRPA